jgi:tetratricopeptide (TPR) repeat protein
MNIVPFIRLSLAVASATLLLGPFPCSSADPDLQEQIDALTKLIQKEPTKPELYVQRGELYRSDNNWDTALADFEYAGTLNPKLPALDLSRGRLFAAAKWWRSAKGYLDRFLLRQPDHAEALILRGRVLVQLGQRLAAVEDFTRALARESSPDLFLERAETLTAEGAAHYETALKGLEEGIKKLGPLVTLQLGALELEVKQKQFDAALTRLDGLTAQAARKETWLERRGDILRGLGRNDEARAAYKSALEALDKIPPVRRNVPATQELEKRLRAALEALPAGGAK